MFFKDIVGYRETKKKLLHIINNDRISHAQLFLGKEGSGNLAMALAYAQYVNCQQKGAEDSCGTCPSCIKFQKLVHPDLHLVFPVATNEKVKKDPVSANFLESWRAAFLKNPYFTLTDWQEIAETGNKQLLINTKESSDILKALSLKTYEAEYKIMLIWFPEKMNASSSNKLLKILEEPPKKTLFLLVASFAEQLLPTIISRVQLVKLNPIDEKELTDYIIEKYQLPKNEAENIARLSDGNVNQLIRIIEKGDDTEFFQHTFVQLMRSAFVGNVPGLIEWTDEIAKIGREKQKQFLIYGLHLFRESLIMNYGDAALSKKNSKEAEFLKKFAPYIHGTNCLDTIELFNDAVYHIERNANPKILFLDVALKLTKLLRMKMEV
ncbi:MAG: DNA polymerase III subunit delta [Flavobacteriales bacterium CG18_big_fil_WC_8_21_14_2_50_32_9]|nr:DNA polymerase III subunit delta [Flavobacteriales bacterium]PIQ15040.1 MAG: DNA polymerase III subunit delta [Flavobacteriales bacterium CG18_big_fil_WC_8_21_14_2_50_32_9]PIZ06589.1 MAG: DNA polymerase III subunit delta [Flavobacteriales bacterium CG_4_10_14_0_8_um_filter_32_5]